MHHYVCMYVCKGVAADEEETDGEFSADTVIPLFFTLALQFSRQRLYFFKFLCCRQRNGWKGT